MLSVIVHPCMFTILCNSDYVVELLHMIWNLYLAFCLKLSLLICYVLHLQFT
jgi:hypothetical protein